jgi:hypothetical protein
MLLVVTACPFVGLVTTTFGAVVSVAGAPWLTEKVLPAIVALPDRADGDVFCVHDTVTEPDPVPLGGDTVSQDPLPDAVQLPPVQPAGAPVIVTS